MVEIGAGESDRGSDGDGVSAAAVGDDFGGGLCDGVSVGVIGGFDGGFSTFFCLCFHMYTFVLDPFSWF